MNNLFCSYFLNFVLEARVSDDSSWMSNGLLPHRRFRNSVKYLCRPCWSSVYWLYQLLRIFAVACFNVYQCFIRLRFCKSDVVRY